MLLTIKILGWILARLPKIAAEGLGKSLGILFFALPSKRKRILESNLHHAFPEKSEFWRRKVALECSQRTMEMGLLVLAIPYLKLHQLQDWIRFSGNTREIIRDWLRYKRPVVLLIPHFTLFEYLPTLPTLLGLKEVNAGAIYRPLDNVKIDKWIRQSRERFGLKLLSRKAGFSKAKEILGNNGVLGILYDQNAGRSGTIRTFFNRLASTTDLPGMMSKRFNADTYIFHPERKRFWEARIHIQPLTINEAYNENLMQKANDWLEQKLTGNPDTCADWLWMHRRWYTQNVRKSFQFIHKKISINSKFTLNGFHLWVRMPNWLGDIIMSLPIIKALKSSRPDIVITLISKSAYIPLLKMLNVGDHHKALPENYKSSYFNIFRSWRKEYPDSQLLLTNSTRGDIESYNIRAPQRLGIFLPGNNRPLLTHKYNIIHDLDTNYYSLHQTLRWERLIRYFGFNGKLSNTPFSNKKSCSFYKIGLVPGASNTPSKCWPFEYWVELINLILNSCVNIKIHLYGTVKDKHISKLISEKIKSANLYDYTGSTKLTELADEFSTCKIIIGNDSGGTHLANALGIPVIVLFGPTDEVVTRPFYDSKVQILSSVSKKMHNVLPNEVFNDYLDLYNM